MNPQLTFVALVATLGVMAIAAPASAWVGAALVAALTFKGLATLEVLPSVATFVDLPLAWGALFVALLKQHEQSPFLRRHLTWLAALALAMAVAWAFNPSEILRPVVYLMLLGQPFAIVGALLADPPSPRMRLALERVLLGLVLIQIPVVALQVAKYGAPSDRIQGTLYGAGAGAHVISAVVVIGGIWILSGGIGRRSLGALRIPIVVALFAIPFLADAKQVIVALPAVVLASSWAVGRLQLLGRAVLAAGAVIVLFTLAPASDTAARYIEQSRHGQGGKQATAEFLWQKLDGRPRGARVRKGTRRDGEPCGVHDDRHVPEVRFTAGGARIGTGVHRCRSARDGAGEDTGGRNIAQHRRLEHSGRVRRPRDRGPSRLPGPASLVVHSPPKGGFRRGGGGGVRLRALPRPRTRLRLVGTASVRCLPRRSGWSCTDCAGARCEDADPLGRRGILDCAIATGGQE